MPDTIGDRAAGAGFRANFHDRFRSDSGSCVKVVVGRKSDKEFRAKRNSASVAVGDRPRQQNPARESAALGVNCMLTGYLQAVS